MTDCQQVLDDLHNALTKIRDREQHWMTVYRDSYNSTLANGMVLGLNVAIEMIEEAQGD